MIDKTVAVRTQGGKDLGVMSQQAFADHLQAEIASRGHGILED
jgi:threonyl-tRNA synthetase